MVETFLSSPFVTEAVLPFLLIFTLFFAILEKTKILGEERRQINAIVSLVIALLLLAFPLARNVITGLMPVLAVIAVVLLVFIMLYAFASGEKELKMPKGIKITFGILIGLALIIALLVLTGYWDIVINYLTGGENKTVVTNVFLIAIIIAAVIGVWATGNKSEKSE